MTFRGTLDPRFSEATEALDWSVVNTTLAEAQLYWLTTVRADGRPHVTPLVGLFVDGAVVFCTGADEQKAVNLDYRPEVAVTTGTNTWQDGLDVVVEGRAQRVTGRAELTELADAYREKYRGAWDFEALDEVFSHPDSGRALVFRVVPAKVIAFAKSPHGQTTFRPG